MIPRIVPTGIATNARTEKIIISILAHSFPENNEIDAIRKSTPTIIISTPIRGKPIVNIYPIKRSGKELNIPRIARIVIPVGLLSTLGVEENLELPQFEHTVLENVFAVPQF